MNKMKEQILLSLYIHMPWCVQKCPYCDFNSHTLKDTLPEELYVNSLIQDLQNDLPLIWGRSIQTIFIGGGTPSLFSPASIERLLNQIRALVCVSPSAEITIEANPGTVEQRRFEGYVQAGVNRLSLGIQSFADDKLKILGRIHSSSEAIVAVEAAKKAGFKNFNLDLMFGLPDQTKAQAMSDLEQAIMLGPTHISWYQLTIEPNTLFHHAPPILPEDDLLFDMQSAGVLKLDQAGFKQYEVSAYARDNHLSEHNLNYWRFGDYLGIGAGAHSKITDINNDKIQRVCKIKHPKTYLISERDFVVKRNDVNPDELAFEFMLNALRLNEEVPIELFSNRTGLEFDSIREKLTRVCDLGLMVMREDAFGLTQQGRLFLNDVVSHFL